MPGVVEAEWVSILNKASGQVHLSKVLKRRRAAVLQIPGARVGRGSSLGAQRSQETVGVRAEGSAGGRHEGKELVGHPEAFDSLFGEKNNVI